jgi:hypothetical protein
VLLLGFEAFGHNSDHPTSETMVQMSKADKDVVMALPGNQKCADCGMKNPQWASVSFGTVFCLECSGVHR